VTTRDEELKAVPLWKADKQKWPPGVRTIGQDEMDCLGIDLYVVRAFRTVGLAI